MESEDLRRRLAELIVEALEVGTGKHERDVIDDVFEAFGISFGGIDASLPGNTPDRTRLLRERASTQLANGAPTAAELLNVVVRCGGRFIAMLEETYARLARHAATTAGSSETFRLERAGVDEEKLNISAAFLEEVRRRASGLLQVPTGAIDAEVLGQFLGWDNGESYGRWPLSPDHSGELLVDAVLHLSWLEPEVRRLAAGDSAWDEGVACCAAAQDAAERLMAAAENLVRSHVAHLDALASVPSGTAALELYSNVPKWSGERGEAETERFRTDRVLGTTAVEGYVAGVDQTSVVGLRADPELEPVVIPIEGYWPSGGVGSLAGFVAMWRRELWAVRRRPDVEKRLLHDPSKLVDWLSWVAANCEEATQWLSHDVLHVTGSIEFETQIGAIEEFLNLPLWRQRHLLYEVWILCATLDACEEADWVVQLSGLQQSAGVWVLSVGQTDEPTATLCRRTDDSVQLDVWREPARHVMDGVLTPDVTVSTPAPYVRDLLVVEAKDRSKMTRGQSVPTTAAVGQVAPRQRTALGVAYRYAVGLRPIGTWVCNHCDFREGDSGLVNHGDSWSHIYVADQFRPGEVPVEFAASVRTALKIPEDRLDDTTEERTRSGLVVVIDVTASMQPRLESVFADLTECVGAVDFDTYRALLYSDHGEDEPFLVRKIGPFPDLLALLNAMKAVPGGAGGDYEEALEDAMQRCRELIDDVGPQTVLVLTDAPPHSLFDCPYHVDFDAQVRELLRLGCQVQVADNWQNPAEDTWADFIGVSGFEVASIVDLIQKWSRVPLAAG